MFYMCTFLKYLECGITFRFTGCLEALVVWSTAGDFPRLICKKGRKHYHHERNHKNERIHNKINIMHHDIHVYYFKVFEMENYIHVWLLPRCCSWLINSQLASLINTLLLPQPVSPILVFYLNSGTPPCHLLLKPTDWKFGVLELILCLKSIARLLSVWPS